MILVDRTINLFLDRGFISITPFNPDQVGPSSYDFRLDNHFMVFNPQLEVIDPRDLKDIMKEYYIKDDDFFVLHPGQFALGGSVESFAIADYLVAQVNGKSSLGRLGLQIHATAGFFDPGWDGVATLELSNVSPIPIRLYPKMLIAQMVFMQGTDAAEHPYGSRVSSKYQHAERVQSSRYGERE